MPRTSTILGQRASNDSRVATTSRMLELPATILVGLICRLRRYSRLSRVWGVRSIPSMGCHSMTLSLLGRWPLVVVSNAFPLPPTTWPSVIVMTFWYVNQNGLGNGVVNPPRNDQADPVALSSSVVEAGSFNKKASPLVSL